MKVKTYSNGLRLVVNTKKDVPVVAFRILVGAGSMNESEKDYGIAHFTEHMFFKSTEKHSEQELSSILDELGASKNASTSYFNTSYYFKCLNNVLNKCIEIYSEMFFNLNYDKKELEIEKGVVSEELKRSGISNSRKAVTNAMESMFNGTPIEHSVLGTLTTIKRFSANKIISFKNEHYIPNNIVISISGAVSFKTVDKLIQKYFVSKLSKTDKPMFELPLSYELCIKKQHIVKHKKITQTYTYILYSLGDIDKLMAVKYVLFSIIFGAGTGSKLFSVMRNKKGLLYEVSASEDKIGNNRFFEIYFVTSLKNLPECLSIIKDELRKCAEGNITQKEFENAKNKVFANIVFSMESNSQIAPSYGFNILYNNKIENYNERVKRINSINLNDIIECAKLLYNNKEYVVSVVGDIKSEIIKKY